MTHAPVVAQVVMPEKGQFLVRCQCPAPAVGKQALVTLDYGQDIGTVTEFGPFDPARHGGRMPGFQLIRMAVEADAAVLEENGRMAREMRTAFQEAAQAVAPDIRVPYARLSFARSRLFVRFTSATPRLDLSPVLAKFRGRFGVSVNAWQMGPRDEVGMLGGLGPCGRPCCCATWQRRYPSHLNMERFKCENPVRLNGTCGRFKCCLAFEKN